MMVCSSKHRQKAGSRPVRYKLPSRNSFCDFLGISRDTRTVYRCPVNLVRWLWSKRYGRVWSAGDELSNRRRQHGMFT